MSRKMQFARRIKSPLPLRSFVAAFLLTLATSASAAPGDLSDVPLYTRGGAEPNIMMLMDSSGSMYEVVLPPEDYDENVGYASCSSPISNEYQYYDRRGRLRTGYYQWDIQYRVKYSGNDIGKVEFKAWEDDSWRAWNASGDCFSDSENYSVRLYADGEYSNHYYTGNNETYSYLNSYTGNNALSGHFLNWFFSKESSGSYVADRFLDEDGTTARRIKLGVDRRTDIMKSAASDLVSDLDDVRVGLMEFNGEHGAKVLTGVASVTDASKANLLDTIADISAAGGTPLAESFAGVGRYFITGHEEKNLSYKGANGNSVTAKGSDIFSGASSYNNTSTVLNWNSVTQPDATVAGGAIQYYCQKSFMVALSDGEPSVDDSISDHLKGYDHNCSNDSSRNCTSSEMDDVIKALYDIDLRPDLTEPDNTPVKNNIISYIIGFAEDGLSDTDVMKNSGALGGGGVYSASNASQLKSTFNTIINKVNAITGSSSSIAFNTTSLEAGSGLYAARFDSGDWSGDLSNYSISAEGTLAETPSWSARSQLDSQSADSRVIFTSQGGTGVVFTDALIDGNGSDHESDLEINTSSGTSVTDDLAADRINYLRGDQTNEGTAATEFRTRSSLLGDIVNSTPVYVGAPNAGWANFEFTGASEYTAFKTNNTNSNRTPVVYVGANDGFLHGFDASTGNEVIAYAPEALLSTEENSGLHALSSQLYGHKYYVDGSPTTKDVYIGGTWKTVLVGSLGGGGKGYFALDVTNPSNFRANRADSVVMWEFTDDDNPNLGYSFSQAQIGRLPNGEWAAIFGNGYNSTNGDAGLFILYLDGSNENGESYTYIPTGSGSENDKNGLSTPSIVDANLDGTIDRIYAGDLKGNLWAFDVSGAQSSGWGIAHGETTTDAGGVNTTTAQPLLSVGEPITGAPLVARNKDNLGGSGVNLLVTFGTGQYLTDADTADNTAGGFYAVSDNGTGGLTKSNLAGRDLDTRNVNQVDSEGVEDGTSRTYRTLSGDELDWSQKSGWYIQLQPGNTPTGEDGGERVITRPDLLRKTLFFNTMVPTGQVCSAGGYGWQMSVDVFTGLAPEDHGVFDANGDGMINMGDQGLVGRMVTSGAPNKSGFIGGQLQVTPTTSGDLIPTPINPGGGEREGRLSWEEATPL